MGPAGDSSCGCPTQELSSDGEEFKSHVEGFVELQMVAKWIVG